MCARTGPHGVSSEVLWLPYRHDDRNKGCAFVSVRALARGRWPAQPLPKYLEERLNMSTTLTMPIPKASTTGPSRAPSVAKLMGLTILVVVLTVLSISLYWLEHHNGHHPTVLGDTDNPDHVTLNLLILENRPVHSAGKRPIGAKGRGLLGGRAHP
jgi:hypothetical protein